MFTQAYGKEMIAVSREGMPLHAAVIVQTIVYAIHSSVFSFAVFTSTTVRTLSQTGNKSK